MWKFSRTFLKSLLLGYIYVLSYYIWFKLSWDTIVYAFVHVSISSVLLALILIKMKKSTREQKFSMASITMWITSIYFQVSSIKYAGQFYIGLISNNNERLMGSMLIAASMFSALVVWSVINGRRKRDYYNTNFINVNKCVVWIFTFLWMYINIKQYLNDPVSIYFKKAENTSMSIFLDVIENVILAILILISLIKLEERNKAVVISISGHSIVSIKHRGYGPLLLLIGVFIFNAIVNGQRSAMFIPVFGTIIGFIVLRKISIDSIAKLTCYIPIIYLLFSLLAFSVSGRLVNTDNSATAETLAYRCDLSDFAYTIAKFTSGEDHSIESVREGILMAVPSFTGIQKSDIEFGGQYDKILNAANLTITDYSDTLFSMGASIGGYVGVFILYILFIIYLEFIDKWMSSCGFVGLCLKLAAFRYFVFIELSWVSFFSTTFHAIIGLIVAWIIVKVLLIMGIITVKPESNAYEMNMHKKSKYLQRI